MWSASVRGSTGRVVAALVAPEDDAVGAGVDSGAAIRAASGEGR